MLRYVLHCSIFFGVRPENPVINNREGGDCPNNSGGIGFKKKKAKGGGAFIRDLRVGYRKL